MKKSRPKLLLSTETLRSLRTSDIVNALGRGVDTNTGCEMVAVVATAPPLRKLP